MSIDFHAAPEDYILLNKPSFPDRTSETLLQFALDNFYVIISQDLIRLKHSDKSPW